METSRSSTLVEERLYLCIAAAHQINAGIAIIDDAGAVWFWNHWLAEKSGLSCEFATGQPFLELFPELKNSRLALAIDDALKRGLSSLLSQSLHKAPLPLFGNSSATTSSAPAERLQQAIHVTPLESKNHVRYCLVQVNDVSIAVKKERLLRDQADSLRGLAYIDSLTGIPNRRRLDEYLWDEFRRAIRSHSPLSVIMVDVDYFKQYNDMYSHSAGDFCLQRVANSIKATLRRPADLVARYGGEEFSIILPDTPVNAAVALAEEIRKHIESLNIPHERSEVAGYITASMGVASILPDSKISDSELLIQADTALYQAKRNGRNRVTLFRPPIQVS
jgi:diguanylate cyclase (GGDEF)-like protein